MSRVKLVCSVVMAIGFPSGSWLLDALSAVPDWPPCIEVAVGGVPPDDGLLMHSGTWYVTAGDGVTWLLKPPGPTALAEASSRPLQTYRPSMSWLKSCIEESGFTMANPPDCGGVRRGNLRSTGRLNTEAARAA